MSVIFLLAESASSASHADEGVSFPPLETWHYPSQIFWLAITFGGLYWALSRMILPKLSANIERRSDTIASDLDEAARLDEQAKEAQQALEVNLAKARNRARQTAADAEAEMSAEIAEETRRVDADIDAKLEAADARLAELRNEAMANVEAVATEATEAMLSKFGVAAPKPELTKAVQTALSPE